MHMQNAEEALSYLTTMESDKHLGFVPVGQEEDVLVKLHREHYRNLPL